MLAALVDVVKVWLYVRRCGIDDLCVGAVVIKKRRYESEYVLVY